MSFMKSIFLLLITLSFSIFLTAQTPCDEGFAGVYPCEKVDLLSVVTLQEMGCNASNDIWGWTDSTTNREYAIFGCTDRTTFVDITDPTNPVFIGFLMGHNNTFSTWRDMKVYQDHAYIVSEANNHGVQVFDLTQLRDPSNAPIEFEETAHVGALGGGRTITSSHNIVLNEESGFAYTVGNRGLCGSGLTALDLSNPADPVFAGCFSADGYTHDAQCVNYIGPDPDYQGAEICFNANEDAVTIVDVSDKEFMIEISSNSYPGVAYTHQGWLTDDHQYFLMNDEVDELNRNHNTRTYIWDVRNLDFPIFMGYYEADVASIDHNLYIKGDYAYMSNYSSGLRILDISDIANGELVEVGSFDVFPQNNGTSFNGTWSNYPFFESGSIIVSSRDRGLFVLKFLQEEDTCNNGVLDTGEEDVDCGGTCTPCPTCDDGILNGDEAGIDCGGMNCPDCPEETCAVYDFTNQVVRYDESFNDQGSFEVQDNGASILITGNGWKAIPIDYNFTTSTVIEFDFKSETEGEIHEVSLDNNLSFAPERRFVIYGTQAVSSNLSAQRYTGSGDWEHFTISTGDLVTGNYAYLVMAADDDRNAAGDSYFRNIKIYEDYDGSLSCENEGSDLNCEVRLSASERDALLNDMDLTYGAVLIEHFGLGSGYFYEVKNLCPRPALGTGSVPFAGTFYTCAGEEICSYGGLTGSCGGNAFGIDLTLASSSTVVNVVDCTTDGAQSTICQGDAINVIKTQGPIGPDAVACCIPTSYDCMESEITIIPDAGVELIDGEYIATPDMSTTYVINFFNGENCAPVQYVHHVEVEDCTEEEPQIFIDNPWLNDLVDPSDCGDASITSYTVGVHTYYHIVTPDGSFLYTSNGVYLCMDLPNYDCVMLYGFTNGVSEWTCGNNKPAPSITDLDLNESKLIATQIYPNPTSHILHIVTDVNEEDQYFIYDIEGKLVQTIYPYDMDNGVIKVDISGHTNGLYFLKMVKNGQVEVQRFVIEK